MLAKRPFAPIRTIKRELVDERHPRTLDILANLRFSRSFADAERQHENNTGFECRKMAAEMMGDMAGFVSKDMREFG